VELTTIVFPGEGGVGVGGQAAMEATPGVSVGKGGAVVVFDWVVSDVSGSTGDISGPQVLVTDARKITRMRSVIDFFIQIGTIRQSQGRFATLNLQICTNRSVARTHSQNQESFNAAKNCLTGKRNLL
jgi:hypothetical protein